MANEPTEPPTPIYPWLATDAEVAQVAARVGVSLAVGDAEELGGNYGRLFLIHRDGDRRVLKIRSRWMTEGRIGFEHALGRCLRGSGVPFAIPLTDGRGRTWTKVGDLFCEQTLFVDGRDASPDAADVRQSGELLGGFHKCARDLDLSLYEPPHFQNQGDPIDLQSSVEQLRQMAKDMEAEDADRLLTICMRWEDLASWYRDVAGVLPTVLRHGDFHPWNLLFSRTEPSRIAVLFDLDMSAIGPRIYDVSYAVHMLRRLFVGWNVEGWSTRYRRFVEGYVDASGWSFSEDELRALPVLIECIALQFLVLNAAQAGFREAADEYKEYIAIVDWLGSGGSELADALRYGLA